MFIVDYKTPEKDYERYGKLFANNLTPYVDDTARFSSMIISMKAVHLLLMISNVLNRPMSEIMSDEEKLSNLVGAEFFTKTMATCLEHLPFGLNLSIVLDHKLLSENTVQVWLDSISRDFVLCTVYFIYEGAHSECYRKYVQKKVDKDFMSLRKTMKLPDFLTCLDRSLHVFNILREKLFLPRLLELHQKTPAPELVEECSGFNSMSAALKGLKK